MSTTENYNPGLLNDWGGGNISWWQDYIRSEIDRANDYWRPQVDALLSDLETSQKARELLRGQIEKTADMYDEMEASLEGTNKEIERLKERVKEALRGRIYGCLDLDEMVERIFEEAK